MRPEIIFSKNVQFNMSSPAAIDEFTISCLTNWRLRSWKLFDINDSEINFTVHHPGSICNTRNKWHLFADLYKIRDILFEFSSSCRVNSENSFWFCYLDDLCLRVWVYNDLLWCHLTCRQYFFVNNCQRLDKVIVNTAPTSNSAGSNTTTDPSGLNITLWTHFPSTYIAEMNGHDFGHEFVSESVSEADSVSAHLCYIAYTI